MNWKARLQSKVFWMALASLFIFIVKSFKLFELPSNVDVIVNVILGSLVTMGILIDPTTPGVYDKVNPPEGEK